MVKGDGYIKPFLTKQRQTPVSMLIGFYVLFPRNFSIKNLQEYIFKYGHAIYFVFML